jgi:hypothetical protein
MRDDSITTTIDSTNQGCGAVVGQAEIVAKLVRAGLGNVVLPVLEGVVVHKGRRVKAGQGM